VERLGAGLCLSGHGRPFRNVQEHVDENRRTVAERMGRVERAVSDGAKTAFEIVPTLMGTDELTPMLVNWGLSESLCYLTHLEREGVVRREGGSPERWTSDGR
jgi:hypothetical protein